MPLYNVEHSFPLTTSHKEDLAERITSLHAQTFTTPSIFVQVKFYQQDASDQNHFVGGKVRQGALNRIIAYVRSSAGRKKEHFDKLAEQIEHAWYVVLDEAFEGSEEDIKEKENLRDARPQKERDAKEMLAIAFVGGIIVREKGFAIPEAGQEGAWIKEFRKQFERKAELGDEDFANMLEEIKSRDDLKGWRA